MDLKDGTFSESNVEGFFKCSHCGSVMDIEEETYCWDCGKGEMIYTTTNPPRIIRRIIG